MTNDWYRYAFSKEYISIYSHRNIAEAQDCVDLILRSIDIPSQSKIADVPCGAGRHSMIFAERSYKVTGIDLSKDLLQSASQEMSDRSEICLNFIRSDIRYLPLKDNTFELVTNLFSSIGYFQSESENFNTIKELVRICKHGGYFVIDFMNAPVIESNLVPENEKTTESGIHVRDVRHIGGTPKRVNKTSTITFPDGTVKVVNESVRLFTKDDLVEILNSVQVNILQIYGDYSGSAWTEQSPRLILISQKL